MSQTLYCTQNDLTNRLSADGITYRTDDAPPANLGDVISDASSIIDEHCWLLYDPTNLITSNWVTQRCADIAAMLLCERRGNAAPPGVEQQYTRAMDRLEQVRKGVFGIPDCPIRNSAAPGMSNIHIRQDAWGNRSVVERQRSVGKAKNYEQKVDRLDPMEYFDPVI